MIRPSPPPSRSHRRLHPIARVAIVASAVIVPSGGLVACGDPGVPLSEWVKEADDVCAEMQAEADLVRPVLFSPPPAELLRKSSELSKREASQLRDLPAPAGDARTQARDYVATLDERNTALDLLATSIELSSADAPKDTDRVAELTQSAADKAIALGLDECRAGVDLSVGGSADGASGPSGTIPDTGISMPETTPPTVASEFGTEDGVEG